MVGHIVCQHRKVVADRLWCCVGSPSGGSRRTSGGSGLALGSGSGPVASSSSDDTSSGGTSST